MTLRISLKKYTQNETIKKYYKYEIILYRKVFIGDAVKIEGFDIMKLNSIKSM